MPVRIDSRRQRLRATVSEAPDAPVTKAVVRMQGGLKGLFVNSRNLCSTANRAEAHFTGHNKKQLKRSPRVRPRGCKGAKPAKRSAQRRR